MRKMCKINLLKKRFGTTALMYATQDKNIYNILDLLGNHADVNKADK